MDIATVAGLVGLAFVDSTSFGTLGIPVVMLTAPRLDRRAFGVFLTTITGFYAALGVALLLGADALSPWLSTVRVPTAVTQVQAGFGAALALWGLCGLPRPRGNRDGGARRHDRLAAIMGAARIPPRAVIGVALIAGLVEAASMLPYLAALGIIGATPVPVAAKIAVVIAYVAVMSVPALLLLAARLVWADRLRPILERLRAAITRHSGETMAWIVAIVGFLIAADAFERLQQVGSWPFG